jgi:hypothetical protein
LHPTDILVMVPGQAGIAHEMVRLRLREPHSVGDSRVISDGICDVLVAASKRPPQLVEGRNRDASHLVWCLNDRLLRRARPRRRQSVRSIIRELQREAARRE